MKGSRWLCLTVLLLTGCYTVKFTNPQTAMDSRGEAYHLWTHSLFWGIIPLGRVNMSQCGNAGVRSMKSQIGGLGLLAYALTGGIWAPMHVKITCAGRRASAEGEEDAYEYLVDGSSLEPINALQ